MKRLLSAIAIVLLAWYGWSIRDSSAVREQLPQELQKVSVPPVPALPSLPSLPSATAKSESGNAARPTSGIYKCTHGAKVIYTEEPCPKGHDERPMSGGSVTVVAGQKPPPPPPPAVTPANGGEPSFMDKQIERVVK